MDPTDYLRFVAALIFVLALIGAGAFSLRAFGFITPGPRRTGERRLTIVEAMTIDARRRLVIVRRDDKEHLLLLGATGETVLENNIDALQIPEPQLTGANFVTIKTEPRL